MKPNRRAAAKQPVRFGLVGILNTAVDYFLFLILVGLIGLPALSNVISYSCGALVSYILNRNWTFQQAGSEQSHSKAIFKFALLTLAMVVLSTSVTVTCASFMSLPLAKFVSVCAVAIVSFLGMKFVVFRTSSHPKNAYKGI